MGDVFSSLGRFVAGPESVFADRQIIIGSIGVTFLLPLCFIRRIGALCALSSVAVVGFLYTSAVVLRNAFIVMAKREAEGLSPFDGVELLRLDYGALFALPIVVFGFNCHANAVRGVPNPLNRSSLSVDTAGSGRTPTGIQDAYRAQGSHYAVLYFSCSPACFIHSAL